MEWDSVPGGRAGCVGSMLTEPRAFASHAARAGQVSYSNGVKIVANSCAVLASVARMTTEPSVYTASVAPISSAPEVSQAGTSSAVGSWKKKTKPPPS